MPKAMKRPAAMLGATPKKAAKKTARGKKKAATPGFLQSLEDNKISEAVVAYVQRSWYAEGDTAQKQSS